MATHVTKLQWHDIFVAGVGILGAPLPREMLQDEGVIKVVSCTVQNEFKVNVYLECSSKQPLIDDLVVLSVTQWQMPINSASESKLLIILVA